MVDVPFVLGPGQISHTFTGTWLPGTRITLAWTGVAVTSPCGAYGYGIDGLLSSGVGFGEQRFGLGTPSGQVEFQVSTLSTSLEVHVFTDGYCSGGTMFGLVLVASAGPGNCQFGTRLGAGVAPAVIVTSAVINAWLLPFNAVWLAPILALFEYSTLNLGTLCGQGPPPMPVINLDTPNASIATLGQILRSVAWFSSCECIPGAPTPTPFPPPVITQPGGWVTPVIPDCTNTDICAYLQGLQRQISALQSALGANYELTTLLQRYTLPFAYIRGATHGSLTGVGTFQISRLVGLEVLVTTTPENQRELVGTPPYVWDLGWLSINTSEGLTEEKRITQGKMVWLSPLMALSTSIGHWITPGVVINITELQAEP